MLQGTFLIASAGVILANLVANLIYGWLDPEGADVTAEATAPRALHARSSRGAAGSPRGGAGGHGSVRHRSGMIGLGILIVFVVVALAAPLLADSSGLDVTQANGPILACRPPRTTRSAPTRTVARC